MPRQRLRRRVKSVRELLIKHASPILVIPARPPWMAEVLETQEQFPVQAGIQRFKWASLDASFRWHDGIGLVQSFLSVPHAGSLLKVPA